MVIKNPIIPGNNADPSICRAGDDFYLVTSTNVYFPGLPIYHSKDLLNWRLINYCLNRDSQLPLAGQAGWMGIWAPTIRYHEGRFYVIASNIGVGHFIVWTDDINGDWSEPFYLEAEGHHDPDIFWDDDGRCYVLRHNGKEGISGGELDLQTGRYKDGIHLVYPGFEDVFCEAPHVYKINGWYYMVVAEGGTYRGHMITVCRAKHPMGPYEDCPHNPLLTHRHIVYSQINQVGHGDLVLGPDNQWWMVFLAIRQRNEIHVMGRETFIVPIEWDDEGWPYVTEKVITEEMQVDRQIALHPWPVNNDDYFDKSKFDLKWNWYRNPVRENYILEPEKGRIVLKSGKDKIADVNGQPTLLLRRQEHYNCRAELDFQMLDGRGEAGLVLWQSEELHFRIGLTYKNSAPKIVVTIRIYEAEDDNYFSLPSIENIIFYIKSTDRFYEAGLVQGEKLVKYAHINNKAMCMEMKGGYGGSCFGLYCTGKDTEAAFESFRYLPDTAKG